MRLLRVGEAATALGYDVEAQGRASLSTGVTTRAAGDGAFAGGIRSSATAAGSSAMGLGSLAEGLVWGGRRGGWEMWAGRGGTQPLHNQLNSLTRLYESCRVVV